MIHENTLVIIPAFNEEERITSVIQGIKQYLPPAEILIVDDGSWDGTRRKAEAEGVKVVSHPFNMGYGTGLQTGYKYALRKGYDWLIQMDGDGQHDPASMLALISVVQIGEADVAIGSRFLKNEDHASGLPSYRPPFLRRVGMRFFGRIASWLTQQRITDPTSGYQAMNRKVLEWVSGDHFPVDYPDADVIIMLHRSGFRIKEVPVQMYLNEANKSMHSGWKPVYYIFKMLLSILLTLMRH
jgi:glycosyltransferase involved in cell wall biosynthesis